MNFLSLIQMLLGGMKGVMGAGGGQPFSMGPIGMGQGGGEAAAGMQPMMAMQAPPPVQQPQQAQLQQIDSSILGNGMASQAGDALQQRNNRLKMMLDQIGR